MISSRIHNSSRVIFDVFHYHGQLPAYTRNDAGFVDKIEYLTLKLGSSSIAHNMAMIRSKKMIDNSERSRCL